MDNIRIGLIGCGSMGNTHAKYITSGEVLGAELVAICDTSADKIIIGQV